MFHILIVSTNKKSLSILVTELEKNDIRISWAESCDKSMSMLREEEFDLILTDEDLTDMKGIECIKKLVLLNPLLNTAAISSLSSGDFHEATEGLGVLMQVPSKPKKKDAKKLIEHLDTILKLTRNIR